MDPCASSSPLSPRRHHHHPVDSICRKLQSIQWCGDRQPHSPFQIPKLSSSSYQRTPRAALRSDLDPILKKRPTPEPQERGPLGARGRGRARAGPTGIPSLLPSRSGGGGGGGGPGSALPSRHAYGYAPATPVLPPPPPTPANLTCSVSSTPGERRDWVGAAGAPGGRQGGAAWQRYCSTPTTLTKDSAAGLSFSRSSVQLAQVEEERGHWGSPALSRAAPSSARLLTYDPELGRTAAVAGGDGEPAFPALVVRRLSLGESALLTRSETRKETMAEVSLICEEDLLDTIFHACDTQHRGKVYVSCIVDYLRHTTSRTSEDSGLEELCNMLDPERTDVSIDLDTYHAIMKEWIDDCRGNGENPTEDLNQDLTKCKDVLSAKRSMLLNMTSGSLEALGGEASRVELETSELVYCVADLQMSSQRLQEEVKTLKQTVELLEESNQRLVEENGELRGHARLSQQTAQREKMLKEELEEMKATLSSTEEGRARALAHSKNLERENHGLTARITSIEEENFKVTMEMEDLQGRLLKLCDINADLQVQIHSSEAVLAEKEQRVHEKSRQMEELKKEVEEYSSITELLRADKTKLENQMRMFHPDMTGRSVSLSVAYRLNQSTSGSLQTELALAQSPLEGVAGATMLDETLDKEVLLLLQGPNPEHMALEFRALLSKLKAEFRAEAGSVLSAVRRVVDPRPTPGGSTEPGLQAVQGELEARRADWVQGLDQLAQYADSLEKELIKMASNMRRSRTEILHLSVRVQEQENQKRQLGEELESLRTPQDSREASCQAGTELEWDAEFDLRDLLKKDLDEKQEVVAVESVAATTSQPIEEEEEEEEVVVEEEEEEEEAGEEKWTVVEDLRGGEGPRDASTPVPAPSEEPGPRPETEGETPVSPVDVDPESPFTSQPLQGAGLCDAHTHSAGEPAGQESSGSHSEALHPHSNSPECTIPLTGSNHDYQSDLPEMDQTVAPGNSPPGTGEMVPPIYTPSSSSPGQETIFENGSPQPSGDPHRGGEGDAASSDMSLAKSPTRVGERAELEDSSGPLPVLMEEEEGASQTVSVVPIAGSDSSPNAVPGVQSGPSREDRLSESSQSKDQNQRSGKAAEDLSEASEKDETSVISDGSEVVKEERHGQSPTDKEIEVEFQRLSLGFKCDLFTLEKRLRLEERSRDLAEENVRKEISSCQGLLQALIPLCDDDGQSMEIVRRLQKNLEILIQSMTRVSSRSEMLGAIHQENRVGRAVEVMFQHVENLKRMYTKEHTELVELRQTLMQNERSFGSQTDKADFRGKSPSSSQYYKPSARRVSIAAIPRSGGSPGFDSPKTQDLSESEAERLTRRSPCPSSSPGPSASDALVSPSLSHTALSHPKGAGGPSGGARGGRGLWLWLAMVVVLAGLLALLACLVMQPAVDAAPVGTGDSWMTIQQLLWPYTGLRHNGQPPV